MTMRSSAALPALSSSSTSFLRSQNKQLAFRDLPRRNRQTVQIRATASASRGKRSSNDDILMVDPLEAKRLAAKQMDEIRAREKLKRQRQIEAINGAWAMIGLTAGLVIEGHTGDSIPSQLIGYWNVITSLFS